MLHLLLGRSGSGKTRTVQEELRKHAKNKEEKLFLLVPEQASFENERTILHALGAKNAQKIYVLSFSRLCDLLGRTYGAMAGKRLSAGGRIILMNMALEQVRDRLHFYRKNANGTELISTLLQGESEFKMCRVSPEDLQKASLSAQTPNLKQKLSELSLILSSYEALVSQSYLDPQDDLTRAANLLEAHPFFENAVVYIDGFQSFTMQEYEILKFVIRQSKEVTVSLCADQLADPEHGLGLFSFVRETAQKLIRLAREGNVPVAAPAVLPEGKRFLSEDLAKLEANLYRGKREKADKSAQQIHLYAAQNLYDEAQFAAASIRRFLVNGTYRCREIAVAARSLEPYRGILNAAFERYEIPFFMDEAQNITAQPLMRLTLSALKAVSSGFETEEILTCIKTNLLGIDENMQSQLENYCFVWQLNKSAWQTPFTMHPGGFVSKWTEKDQNLLTELNEVREKIMIPMVHLREKTKDTDGKGMAKAVYDYLTEAGVQENLRNFADSLEQGGAPALADNTLRLWDLLMEILDQCAMTISERPISRTSFLELLRMVISESEMASIPQGLDEVTIGAANRIRMAKPKVVFLLGVCQGDFPQTPSSGGILSFSERLSLIDHGLPLSDPLSGVAVQERFLAYQMASAPSERLYVSWPINSSDGTQKQPSSLVSEISALFPHCPVESEMTLPESYFAGSKKAAFELLARRWNHKTAVEASLRQLFSETGEEVRMNALEKASKRGAAVFQNSENAQKIFPKNMRVSATQIETYHQCRFRYFCRYGMNIEERRMAKLDALEYGSLMHYLLEHLFREIGAQKILKMGQRGLRENVDQQLLSYAQEKLGGTETQTARFSWLLQRVAEAACVVIWHIAEELSQSRFSPTDFELPVGQNEIPGLKISLSDGGSVEVDGKIDRVDADEIDGNTYLRVVDYKTGKKMFRLSDILDGTNLQMLIYLAALCENGGSHWKNPKPAGILYMPADRPAFTASRKTDDETIQKDQNKKLRMNGLLLDDPGILSDMEEDGKGTYIPAALKNGAPTTKSSVVSSKDFELILQSIRKMVKEMAEELHRGNVEAQPLNDRETACKWCPYGAVCMTEEGMPVRETKSNVSVTEAVEILRRGESDET